MKQLFERFTLGEWMQIIFTAAGIFPALWLVMTSMIIVGGC